MLKRHIKTFDNQRNKRVGKIATAFGDAFGKVDGETFFNGASGSNACNDVQFEVNDAENFRRKYLKGDVSSDDSADWQRKQKRKRLRKTTSSPVVLRRSQRNVPKVIYSEISEKIEDDSYLHCYECNEVYPDGCPNHPINWVFNIPVACPFISKRIDPLFTEYFDKSMDKLLCKCKKVVKNHISRTMPKMVELKDSKIEGAGLGIWTNSGIGIGTTFGPYIGEVGYINKVKDPEFFEKSLNGYTWLVRENIFGLKAHLIDASDGMHANWLRYINCARFEEEQNLVAIQYKGRIFYRACREIECGEELLTYYGLDFAKDLGICSNKVRCRKKLELEKEKETEIEESCDESNSEFEVSDSSSSDNRSISSDDSSIRTVFSVNLEEQNEQISQVKNEEINREESHKNNSVSSFTEEKLMQMKFTGRVFTQDIAVFIGRMCLDNPRVSNKDIREALVKEFGKRGRVNEMSLSQFITKYGMRPKYGIRVKLDEEMKNAILNWKKDNPEMTGAMIKHKLETQFPQKLKISVESIYNYLQSNGLGRNGEVKSKSNETQCGRLTEEKLMQMKFTGTVFTQDIGVFIGRMCLDNPRVSNKDIREALVKEFGERGRIAVRTIYKFMHKYELR